MSLNDPKKSLRLIKTAFGSPEQLHPELTKAFTQSGTPTAGLTAYDLQPGALHLYPVDTPLRNRTPRVGTGIGTQANWKAITGINVNNVSAGLGQGNRGGVMATSSQDYMAAYRGLGLDDYVTFEADYAAQGFDDVKALAVQGLLRSLMIGEEKVILGGNTSLPLGTTPTPSLSTSTAGGALAAQTWSVICAALTLDGYLGTTVTSGINGQIIRTNADGSQDTYGGGSAKKSANATIATTGTTSQIAGIVAPVSGAVAYAWFWGAAGAEILGAITTINSVAITAAASGTQLASALTATDSSTNGLVFDGLLTQVVKGGGYYAAQPTGAAGVGTPLTADGTGGIVELDAALKWFWDYYRLSPTTIWVSSQEQLNITHKVLNSQNNGAQRFVINPQQGAIAGGDLVTSYLNKFSMQGAKSIPILLHPNLPAGTILFDTDEIPYPLSGIGNVKQIKCRRDYYQIEWPLVSRKYQYGVYFDGVLQNYFPPAFGIITNIANG